MIYELVIERSKFQGYLFELKDFSQVKNIIDNLWKEHKKARHICYAAIVEGQEKIEDDGEPSGTAGRPIHNILKYNNEKNMLLVVVRYFGGKKLGAGRLLRSYSKCASTTYKKYNEEKDS